MGRSPAVRSGYGGPRIASLVLSGQKASDMAGLPTGHPETSVGRWTKQLLASGKGRLMPGALGRSSSREEFLEGQVEEYKAALGEAHAELRC